MTNTCKFSVFTLLQQFQNDRQGGVLVLYAGLALPLFAIVGGAIDYSRVASARSDLLRASESAASTAANLSSEIDDAQPIFDAHFKANLSERLKNTAYEFQVDDETGTITATINHPVKMHFAAILGIRKVNVSVQATGRRPIVAEKKNPTPAEIKEVVDTSDIDELKKRIMSEIRERVKRARRNGAKLPQISEEKLEKFAEQMARRAKR